MRLVPHPRQMSYQPGSLARDASDRADERLDAASLSLPPQGYRLTVTSERIVIEAKDAAGLFYGRATLDQLRRFHEASGAIPAVTIEDWPDFPERGVMLDVSRDKVPTMATLYRLIDELASLKINRLQLYFEHTFAYPAHPIVWAGASPLTAAEVEALDAYCRERFIELVPNQNSFGHMERWLKHPEYAYLAEIEGPPSDLMSLCPTDPRSIEFLAGLYDELLPHFTSRSFNVGCDETTDLGKGRSREAVEQFGRGPVYLEFLKSIHGLVSARGRRMQFWGDIVLEHPELIAALPPDVLALEWGYEADHPFDREGERFAESRIEYQVCPGTSSWLSLGGRSTNALANIEAAAASGLAHGASGMLITDWGDLGHWQPLPVSYLGFTYGAAVAWCHETNRELDVAAALDAHIFRDRAEALGGIARGLGDVYRDTGVLVKNASVLALLLLFPERPLGEGRLAGLNAPGLEAAGARAAELAAQLSRARCERDDGTLLAAEFALAADLMRHACELGLARLAAPGSAIDAIPSSRKKTLAADLDRIVAEYERIWRLRNREGGLSDSVARMKRGTT